MFCFDRTLWNLLESRPSQHPIAIETAAILPKNCFEVVLISISNCIWRPVGIVALTLRTTYCQHGQKCIQCCPKVSNMSCPMWSDTWEAGRNCTRREIHAIATWKLKQRLVHITYWIIESNSFTRHAHIDLPRHIVLIELQSGAITTMEPGSHRRISLQASLPAAARDWWRNVP